MFELQEQMDRISQELATALNQANELNMRCVTEKIRKKLVIFRNIELEAELSKADKEMRQAKEQANSSEHQLQEVIFLVKELIKLLITNNNEVYYY